MKYSCPHCNETITCKWYESKTKLQCKRCSKFVFESVKQKLSFVSFVSALCGILSIFFFMEVMTGSLYIRIPMLLISLTVLVILVATIEKMICSSITSTK